MLRNEEIRGLWVEIQDCHDCSIVLLFCFFVQSDWIPSFTFGPFHHTNYAVYTLGTRIVNHVDVTERVWGVSLRGWEIGHFVLTNRGDHRITEREADTRKTEGRSSSSSEHWEQTGPQTWQKVCWEPLWKSSLGVVFWMGLGVLVLFLGFYRGGILQQKKKKKSSLWPPPPSSPPHCLGGIGCQPPFVYLPSPAFPLAAQFLLFTAFCMKVAICEDYPAWGQHRVRKKKRNSKEDTVAWVLILTQGTSEDMGSVSNQEFPGGVTKNKMKLTFRFFLFIKLSCEGVSIWLQGSIYLFF